MTPVNTLCRDLSPILKMVGDLINIFKLLIPLILITLCIIDLGKSVISKEPIDIKKNVKGGVKKLCYSVLVFFVPTICMLVFGFVSEFREIKTNSGIDFDTCYDCMFRPSSKNCKNAVEIAELKK